jgi:hypothetical protein
MVQQVANHLHTQCHQQAWSSFVLLHHKINCAGCAVTLAAFQRAVVGFIPSIARIDNTQPTLFPQLYSIDLDEDDTKKFRTIYKSSNFDTTLVPLKDTLRGGDEDVPSMLFYASGELVYRFDGAAEVLRVVDWIKQVTPEQIHENFWHSDLDTIKQCTVMIGCGQHVAWLVDVSVFLCFLRLLA